jgi:hypothetical protein
LRCRKAKEPRRDVVFAPSSPASSIHQTASFVPWVREADQARAMAADRNAPVIEEIQLEP